MEIIKLKNKTLTQGQIKKICEVLAGSGIVLYPTETCYGIGVDATDELAVSKLLDYKNRPPGKAVSVAVGEDEKDLAYKLIEKNKQTENIFENFLPGPITLVGKSKGYVDKRLESEIGTLGVRVPAYKPILQILSKYENPVTSTSANLSGEKTPYNVQEMLSALPDSKKAMIDLVIDAGKLPKNPPSLVIDSSQLKKVYRGGLLTPEDIEHGESFITKSEAETRDLASKFIKEKFLNLEEVANILIFLKGELGAGKTQFAAGIGAGLGIKKIINSPTFQILKEYALKKGTFYHADLWRVEGDLSLVDLGVELGNSTGNVVAVEWPGKLVEASTPLEGLQYKEVRWSVKILKLGPQKRRIILTKIRSDYEYLSY
jgi:L-threonylcarbamoyladenylate synthase